MFYVDINAFRWCFVGIRKYSDNLFLEIIKSLIKEKGLNESEYCFCDKAYETVLKNDSDAFIVSMSKMVPYHKVSKKYRDRLVLIEEDLFNAKYDEIMNAEVKLTRQQYQSIIDRLEDVEYKLHSIHIRF